MPLSPRQQTLLDEHLPGHVIEKDHSWGLVETTVLEVTHGGSRHIVKAGGPADRHIEREIDAHRRWLRPWTEAGRAPTMEFGDAGAKLLVTAYLPGELVLGGPHAREAETFRQAGELLALLHGQAAVPDETYEHQANSGSLERLDGPHRIEAATVARLRAEILSWPTPAATVVPTHGDWQPRNWLIERGVVGVIDFGRAGLRPAYTDFVRLAAQDFRADPGLEAAFVAGYGSDPRTDDGWHRNRVREAVGTACWAYRIGSEDFELQGHRMIAEALADG